MCGPNRCVEFPGLCLVFVVLFGARLTAWPEEVSTEELDKAVVSLRNVNHAALSGEQRKAKGVEINQAWKTIHAAGASGVARLVAELDEVIANHEKDEYFKLNASALLWITGRLKHAEKIGEVWNASKLHVNPNYVFFPAFEAARTQDPRALPMLGACLKDKKGNVRIAAHAMKVAWPLTHEFIWGAYGPKGLPVLERILRSSKDSGVLQSAMLLLSRSQHLAALTKIRQLAAQGEGEVCRTAVECLGMFGHPQDFELLVSTARSKDAGYLVSAVIALKYYQDLRGVPCLVPLLNSPHAAVRRLTIGALYHLATPASLNALEKHSRRATSAGEKEMCKQVLARMLIAMDLTWEAYAAESAMEKAALMAGLRARKEAKYKRVASDRRLTHEEFVKAMNEWKRRRRTTGGTYAWVKDRHVLAVVTPKDLGLLLEVKAAIYGRLSGECLSDIRILDQIVTRLGRCRYRKIVGVCKKVEPR